MLGKGEDFTEEELPAVVKKLMNGSVKLSELLPGDENELRRRQIVQAGMVGTEHRGVKRHFVLRPEGEDDGELVSMAAVLRAPGTTDVLIQEIEDFSTNAAVDRIRKIDTLWRVFRLEGLANNAVKKMAALIAKSGRFKVRKAKKGKKQKAKEQLTAVLEEFAQKVNSAGDSGSITGYRGLRAVVYRAVRNALVEGDWFGREHWVQHEVPGYGKYSLPMTIQSISARNMETDPDLAGVVEQWFWAPSSSLINTLQRPKKEQREKVKNFIDSKLLNQLVKDRRVELDPSLLLHLQHLGSEDTAYGESFLTPMLFAIAYKRAVEDLDLVSIKNLVNRIVILKVGSSDKDSPYRDPQTQLLRANKLAQSLEEVGPHLLLVWQGDDVEVEQVSAHESVLDLNDRHNISHTKVRLSTGLPEAILGGTGDGSKASGFAAMIGAQTVTDEMKSAVEQMFTELGERIAFENGFTDFEIIYEFDNVTALDPNEEWNQLRLDYQQGTCSIRHYLIATGKDPDAMFLQKCEEMGLDPGTALWKDVFAAPLGLPGQAAPPGMKPDGSAPSGRPPDSQTGPTEQERPTRNTPEEDS